MSERKAYVMAQFMNDCDPVLTLVRDKDSKIVDDKDRACSIIREKTLLKVIETILFVIPYEAAENFEDIEYTEDMAVDFCRNGRRFMRGMNVEYGRQIVLSDSYFVVGGICEDSHSVMGWAKSRGEALRQAWVFAGYDEEYTGSDDQLDRLNCDFAFSVYIASKKVISLLEEGYDFADGLFFVNKVFSTDYEICTREEYIHAMVNYDKYPLRSWLV